MRLVDALVACKSRPTRACGLKLNLFGLKGTGKTVTPHTGVWIETEILQFQGAEPDVTPHTGVWIETLQSFGA